jgi:hypothetical protein
MAVTKTTDKLTDAEKKKVKQANKARANPEKAAEKAKINLKRRITRGQIVDPTLETAKKKADPAEDVESIAPPKEKQTDSEKIEKKRLRMLAAEKEFQEKLRLADKERFQGLLKD